MRAQILSFGRSTMKALIVSLWGATLLPVGVFAASSSRVQEGDSSGFALLLVVLVGLAVYFLPTIIAKMREKDNIGMVVVINLFLGWSFIGWVVALAMAFGTTKNPASLS